MYRRCHRYVRLFASLTCGAVLVSTCGPAISSAVTGIRTRLSTAAKQGGGDYTDSPGPVDYGTYPLVDPVTRGFFYYPDDLSAFNLSDEVEAGVASPPADPGYIQGGLDDSGDDMILDGRPAALPRDQSPGGGGFLAKSAPGKGFSIDQLFASTEPAPAPEKHESAPNLTELFRSLGAKAQQGGGGDGNGGGGLGGAGNTNPRAGEAFPWESFLPGGGSTAAPGFVNTQTGNRFTALPVVGWTVPGGMGLGLTLFHNSQDNLDVGWGMNWRSSFDMRVVFAGNYTGGKTKAVVTYPTGKRLVFTNPHPTTSNVWYPPTGFYDVLYKVFQSVDGLVNVFQLRTKRQLIYSFDGSGYLASVRDRFLNRISITRNISTHLVSSVSDQYGNSLTFNNGLNPPHYANVTCGPTGQTYTFGIGAQQFNPGLTVLHSVTYPAVSNGASTTSETFGYDLGAAILNETDRNGQLYKMTYDSYERETSFNYPVHFYQDPYNPTGSAWLSYSYSYGGTSTTLTDPYNNTVINNYDGGTLHSVVDQAHYSQTYWWDINYNCNQYASARQLTSYYGYDNYGNRTWAQDPRQSAANVKQRWSWNSNNDILTTTDTRGAVTYYNRSRDSTGVLLNVVDGLNNTLASYTYASTGQLATVTSENVTTTTTYDASFRPISVQTPDDSFTITYPAANQHQMPNHPGSVTDNGLNLTVSVLYDYWGRATTFTRSFDGNSESITFDPMNRATDFYDWKNQHFQYTYDAVGRVTGTPTTTLAWFDLSSLAGVKDGNGNLRRFYYTARAELKNWSLPDGESETGKFDGDGNETLRFNGLGNQIQYGYDNSDNQVSTTYPAGIPGVTFAWDLDGRPTSMTDSTGTTNWTFDNADRLTNFNSPEGNLTYAHDQWGRRTQMSRAGTPTLQYNYTNHRLTSLVNLVQNETTSWNFDSIGRPYQQVNSNGSTATSQFDGLSRLSSITHSAAGGGSIFSETYQYDADSYLINKTSNGVSTNYFYNQLGELTDEQASSNPNVHTTGDVHYAYDGNFNRLYRNVYNTYSDKYAYDSGDKLNSVTRDYYDGFGYRPLKSYQYDAAGHTTQVANNQTGQTQTLNYDIEDRISSIQYSGGGLTSFFGYNALDARVSKTDSSGSRTFARDGEGASSDVLSDGSNTYVPGISIHTGTGTRTYHQDSAGTNRAETDATQTVQATRAYDAFGMSTAVTGTPAGAFGYGGSAGYQEDSDSGLKLLGHRYYDPSTGRFITRDPAADGTNWYAYCGNSPTNALDPTGLGGPSIHHASPMDEDGGRWAVGGGGDPWDGGYWSGEGRIWGGAAGAIQGLPGGICSGIKGFVEGGWQDPLYGTKMFVAGIASNWNDACKAWNGDCDAFGRLSGQLAIAVTIALVTDGLGSCCFCVEGEMGLASEAAADGALDGGGAEGACARGVGCFVAGTRVLMADGSTKPMQEIKVGDLVASRSDNADPSAPIDARRVTGTSVHPNIQVETLTLQDGTKLQTTREHPFYVPGRGFVVAGALRVGSAVSEGANKASRVASVSFQKAGHDVYNFTVSGNHTYFVVSGGRAVWVHNGACPTRSGAGSGLPARSGGPPNGSLVSDLGDGEGTIRTYDGQGRAETDYDFGHDHTGAGDPHAHDWDWDTPGLKKRRRPGRPLRPGE